MEEDTRLMRVIREMRSQINKLERENQALRGEPSSGTIMNDVEGAVRRQAEHRELEESLSPSAGDREIKGPGSSPSALPSEEAPPTAHMRRVVSASGALGLQEPQRGNNIMTVRRYSISSTVHAIASSKSKHSKRYSRSSSFEVNQPSSSALKDFKKEDESIAKIPSRSSTNSITSTRSLQKYMYKCRGNVKAVKFLLPVDMSSYTENQRSFKCPQNQESHPLSTIIEKDP
ncbi:putative coiled-coil domain-containing protein 195 [Ambystoma mexicanum]|uniref:putative coiled-coil domain-containing protein 195 n=1 Tax=Ambystoma mexicanum TaxID=8296 RepID=UPI0037E8B87D